MTDSVLCERSRGDLPESATPCFDCVYDRVQPEGGGKTGPTLFDRLRAHDDPKQALAEHYRGDGA
jgi:hypothetical protein